MSRFVNPVPQFYLNNGDIASAGKLYFYETGTTTKKDTYSNFAQSVKNTNPVILSGEGRCPNIFGSGRYTVVFKDSNDIEQWTRDDVELSVEIGQYSDWSPILTYRVNDIVRGSDGEYYRSITSTNIGNDPIASSANWERIGFITYWNKNVPYGSGDNVLYNGLIYISSQDNNAGNIPTESSTEVWADASEPREWVESRTYNEGDIVIYGGLIYRSLADDNVGNDPPSFSGEWSNLSLSQTTFRATLEGNFVSGSEIVVSKIGSVVTITSVGSLVHDVISTPNSQVVLPADFRPGQEVNDIVSYETNDGQFLLGTLRVTAAGRIGFFWRTPTDGTLQSCRGTENSVTISYVRSFEVS